MEYLREEDNRIYTAITESKSPLKETRPAPSKSTRSAQLKETLPSPEKDVYPSPTESTCSAPSKSTRSAQLKETRPSPEKDVYPSPTESTRSAPSKSTRSAPSKSSQPAPSKSTRSAPSKSTQPVPSKSTQPAQSGTGDFRCEKTSGKYDFTGSAARFGGVGGFSLRDFFRSISPENWVDIFCLPITCVGILFIITEFQAVTEALFSLLYPVIEAAVFILGVAVIGVVLWLMIRRRRRYYRW